VFNNSILLKIQELAIVDDSRKCDFRTNLVGAGVHLPPGVALGVLPAVSEAFKVLGAPSFPSLVHGKGGGFRPRIRLSSPWTLLLSSPFPPSQISNLKFQISVAVAFLVVFAFAFAFSPHPHPPQNPVQDPRQRRHCFGNTSGVIIPQNGDHNSREKARKWEGRTTHLW
jgi:hypothetical protein